MSDVYGAWAKIENPHEADLSTIAYAFKLAEHSLRKIKQNLAMSFAYNSLTISMAAGLLYGIRLFYTDSSIGGHELGHN
jgi:hypothetical protein